MPEQKEVVDDNETIFKLRITERKFIVAWALVVLLLLLIWSLSCIAIGYFLDSHYGGGKMIIQHYHADSTGFMPQSNLPMQIQQQGKKDK